MKKSLLIILTAIFISSVYSQSWNEVQYIYPNPGGNTTYGIGLAMDAEYTIIGATNDYYGPGGSISIYKNDYSTDSLQFLQKIGNPDGVTLSEFGCSVSLDGDFAVVGNYKEKKDTAGLNVMMNAGAAYVFKKDSLGIWSFYQKLVANNRSAQMGFGKSVAISDNRIMVSKAFSTGVYCYLLDSNGVWNQSQYIADGNSISISGDKSVVGIPNGTNLSSNVNSGVALLYKFNITTNSWLETDSIKPPISYSNDNFGESVSINNNRIIIGAPNHDYGLSSNYLLNAGAAYIYNINGTNQTIFDQKIIATVRKANANYGSAVAIYKNLCTVAAVRDSIDYGPMGDMQTRGASYVYRKINTWNNVMTKYGLHTGQSFGSAVAINNVYQITSALPFDLAQDNAPNGLIRIYKNDQPLIDSTNIVECNSYTDSNGVYYGASTEFYEVVDNNENSQDIYFNSIIINMPITNLIVDSICSSTYTSPSGNYIYTQDGIYYDTIPLVGNTCDSVIRIDLKFPTINTQVTVSGDSLIAASDSSIVHYQWLSCDNNYSIISNEISNVYIPNNHGRYAVELVSSYNCIDTSSCYYTTTSIFNINKDFQNEISLYPNPSNGSVNINFDNEEEFILIKIENLLGENVFSREYHNTKNINLQLNVSTGIYTLQILNKQGKSASKKIIVK